MNWRNAILTAITVLLLLAALVPAYKWFFSEPLLTVYLRCDVNISGKLSVAKILQNGESGKEETFDLVNGCKTGKIEIGDYRREEVIQFTFERGNGEIHKVVSEYGPDIQSDQNGFYTILKITKNLPFITKDSI